MNIQQKSLQSGILLSFLCLLSINTSFGKDNESPEKTSDPNDRPLTSGKVITSTAQKREAASQAVEIKEHDGAVTPDLPTSAEVKRPTVAIALGGGGARGAAHIGVLKVLKENNIPIDYIVGNSMGSIVGGMYSAGVPLDDIEKMLEDGSLRKAYTPSFIPPKILISPFEKLAHPWPRKDSYAGLFSGKTFEKYLRKKLPSPDMKVTDTKITFSAVACNLVDGQAYRISDGSLAKAIHASSAIYPLLKPVVMDDKIYIDGGVRANLPASSARETGADIVIAVLVDEPLQKIPPKKFKHLAGIASRIADVVLAVADERQLQFADIIINPDCSGVPVLSKHGADADKAELAGEMAARKALPEILKQLQHPKPHDAAVAAQTKYPI